MYYKITELFIKRKYLVEITQPRLIKQIEVFFYFQCNYTMFQITKILFHL